MTSRVSGPRIFFGIPASPGLVMGRVYVLDRGEVTTPRYHIEAEEVPLQIHRFARARARAQQQLEALRVRTAEAEGGSEAAVILDAHVLISQDPDLIRRTEEAIETRLINAEWALRDELEELKAAFSALDDAYFRERGNDLDQVGQRILRVLAGHSEEPMPHFPEGAVVVARDLTPADTARLANMRVAAFVTEVGGRTSHTAILARSLDIPAVVGISSIASALETGDMVIVDGDRGVVILEPEAAAVADFERRSQARRVREEALRVLHALPGRTADGTRVRLHANLELPQEAHLPARFGAEGVGLFRTEFLFLNRDVLPDEEEQYANYLKVIEQSPGPVVIRTLDLGGDKLPVHHPYREPNPALGLRAIRYCLAHPEVFRPQIRAILRAARHGDVRMLLPLISSIEEVRRAKAVIEECRGQLRSEGQQIPDRVPLGVMIETPAACLIADRLAAETDFFSVGTNDLVQYTLAIDRANEHLAHLAQPLHPAVLELLRLTTAAAERAGIECTLCGEAAAEVYYVPALLSVGFRAFSMNPVSIPQVKEILSRLTIEVAEALTLRALQEPTPSQARAHLIEGVRELLPEMLD